MDQEATRASCTKQADKTAPVQVNAFGKIRFDNKNLRYLYPEQGTGRARKEKCQGGKQSTQSRHTKPSTPARSQSAPGRQHRAEADGIHINTYQFSLRICRLSSAGTEQWYNGTCVLRPPPHPPAQPPAAAARPHSGHRSERQAAVTLCPPEEGQ